MVDRPGGPVAEQVLLADVRDVGRILAFGEQVVERLVAPRAHLLGDRLVPFLAVGEDRVDVEHHAAEIELLVAYDVAAREARPGMGRRLAAAAGLRRVELRPGRALNIDSLPDATRFPRPAIPGGDVPKRARQKRNTGLASGGASANRRVPADRAPARPDALLAERWQRGRMRRTRNAVYGQP